MAFNYKNAQNTALRLIKNFGTAASISRVTSLYDPVEEWENVTDVQTDAVDVVNLPASSGTVQAFDNQFLADYKKSKIRFFYVAAKGLTFEPGPGDLFYYEGKVWEVAGATPLNPAGTSVLYTMGVKSSNLSTLPVGTVIFDPAPDGYTVEQFPISVEITKSLPGTVIRWSKTATPETQSNGTGYVAPVDVTDGGTLYARAFTSETVGGEESIGLYFSVPNFDFSSPANSQYL